MMSSVKLGFIGTGGNANRHMRELQTIDGAELVAFCDVALEKAEKAAQDYSGRAYEDYNEMLDKEDLDAVYISIPPFAHGGPERAVIKAGLPMFVEKPVHMDAKDAREIAKMVEETGLITASGYQERYLDVIAKAKELLKERRVGFFMGYWMGGMPGKWWREKAKSGGQILEQTTHEIDMARYLFGEVKTVHAVQRKGLVPDADYDVEEASAVSMEFESGVFGVMFSACFIKAGMRRSGLDIFCDDGSLEYHLRKSLVLSTAEGTQTWEVKSNCTIDMDSTFVEAVRTGDGSKILSPYPDAVKSAELSIAANESLETGKVIDLSQWP
ncbi:Gfo/Idh/MocA family protein [Candidatus Poribacteria bacterium]